MQASGMTPMQVIAASTANAAAAMSLAGSDRDGREGKDADLVILTADPSKRRRGLPEDRLRRTGGVLRTIQDLSAQAR